MRLRATAAFLLLLAASVAPGRAALAQAPSPPRDSIPVDPIHSVSFGDLARGTVNIASYLAVGAVATSGLLLSHPSLFGPKDSVDVSFARPHVYAYAAAGVGQAGGADDRERLALQHAYTVEMFNRGIFADARAEYFYVPDHLRVRTVRVGYLAQPRRGVLGGVTTGYRDVRAPRLHGGVEVGFPLVVSIHGGWMRIEPSYVLGDDNYNLRFVIAPDSRVLGVKRPAFVSEIRVLGNDDFVATMSLMFGLRLDP